MCRVTPVDASSATPTTARTTTTCSASSAATATSSSKESNEYNATSYVVLLLRHLLAVTLPLLCPPGDTIPYEGLTRWWLRLTLMFLVLPYRGSKFLKFLTLTGIMINVGWYAVSNYDYYILQHDMGNILYRNVRGIRNYTIDTSTLWDDQVTMQEGQDATMWRIVSHILDTVLHAGVCLGLCWYCFAKKQISWQQLIATPNVVGCFAFARSWSVWHNFRCHATMHPYYYGTQVYYLPLSYRTELWTAAYVAEAIAYVMVILYKVFLSTRTRKTATKLQEKEE